MAKYGEIILESESTLRIICVLCSDTFLTLENFKYHVFKHLKTESDDSTDSYLDFVFKNNSDSEEVQKDIEQLPSSSRKHRTVKNQEEICNTFRQNYDKNKNIDYSNESIDINESVGVSLKRESVKFVNKSESILETKNNDNLEKKFDYDYNILKITLKNCFKLFNDYCPICLETFSSVDSLMEHTKIHLREQTKEEVLRFYNKSIKNLIKRNILSDDETLTIKSIVDWEKSKKNQCLYCEETFGHDGDLQLHIRKHFKSKERQIIISCKLCNNNETKFKSYRKYSIHMLEYHNIEKAFECNRCPDKFKTCTLLNRHVRFHNDDKRYKCEYCSKSFMENGQRKLHIRTHHTFEGLHQCDECGKRFGQIKDFKIHKLRHANKREFNCTKCLKKFITRYDLNRHSVVHTKEKNYQCNICNSKFSMRTALWTHNQLHSNEKKYTCKICDKTFAQSGGLYSHMKKHANKDKLIVNKRKKS